MLWSSRNQILLPRVSPGLSNCWLSVVFILYLLRVFAQFLVGKSHLDCDWNYNRSPSLLSPSLLYFSPQASAPSDRLPPPGSLFFIAPALPFAYELPRSKNWSDGDYVTELLHKYNLLCLWGAYENLNSFQNSNKCILELYLNTRHKLPKHLWNTNSCPCSVFNRASWVSYGKNTFTSDLFFQVI